MLVTFIVLIIIIELIAASWIVYFLTKLDREVILLNEDIEFNKKDIYNALSEYRLKCKELDKKTSRLIEDNKLKKILGIIKLISPLLPFKR